jgi:hypothetical protein
MDVLQCCEDVYPRSSACKKLRGVICREGKSAILNSCDFWIHNVWNSTLSIFLSSFEEARSKW